MKNLNWIYILVALGGGLTFFILDKEVMAGLFVTFVWGVYEKMGNITKAKKIKEKDEKIQYLNDTFKEVVGSDVNTYKQSRRE